MVLWNIGQTFVHILKVKGRFVLPPAFWAGGVASHWWPPLPGGAFDAAGAGAAFPAGVCSQKKFLKS